MKKYIAIITILVTMLFLASCTAVGTTGTTGNVVTTDVADAETLALAECLTDSGAKFYGASWCPHCNDQKDMFGSAVTSIPYVECTENQAACNAAGITGYPTWIFADGTVTQGAQSLGVLAQLSGCEV